MFEVKISGFADEIASDLTTQIKTMKDIGINYLCVRSVDGKNIADFTYEAFMEDVYPRIQQANLFVSSLGSPIGKIQYDDLEAFEKQCHQLHELCKIARGISCKYIRIFSFYVPHDVDYEGIKETIIKKLKIYRAIADLYNVTLLHENEKDIYGDTKERCLELAQSLYDNNFQLIFDFANFVQVGEDPMSCFEVLKPYVAYIHIKDALYDKRENVVAGTGDGMIPEILTRFIKEEGYQGFLTMEPHLVVFDSLKSLEIEDTKDMVTNRLGLDGPQAYKVQYDALTKILQTI